MDQHAFDTRNLPDNLMSAGIGERQATAIADAIIDSRQGLATQADLGHLRTEMKNFETRMINFEAHTNDQFAVVNSRLVNLDGRVDRLQDDVAFLKDGFIGMRASIEILDAKIDGRSESLDAKIDNRYDALDAKIDNVAESLGAKIDNINANRVSERWIQGLLWLTALAIIGAMIQFQN